MNALRLRAYSAADEDACIALWLKSWQAAYPDIDFAARLEWWRQRWREQLVPAATIVVAEADGAASGFVTVDPGSGYVDQLVVAPQRWRSGVGTALIEQAKRIAPRGLTLDVNIDNARAIGFYRRCGFAITGAGQNPISGRPVHRMSWRP
ncbi:MAG TPA: GNAT family N-acetyltransferase [Xanthobacteraceae bacterium]|nr:GNAT family N-acetyltransferase [Xanthobacteraceae bacterium]